MCCLVRVYALACSSWYRLDIALTSPWYRLGIALVLPWYCLDIALRFHLAADR
jgi:hypothetical protein